MRRKKTKCGSRTGSPYQPHACQLEFDLRPPLESVSAETEAEPSTQAAEVEAERSNRSHTYYGPRRIAGMRVRLAACWTERRRSIRPETLDAEGVRAMMRDPPSALALV